jgi:hypothetical protein
LKPADEEVFRKFKEQSRNGFYAPVEVVFDPEQGYVVKAKELFIDRFTIICEYAGEVVDMNQSEEVMNSDALFEFHTTTNSNLVIYPDKKGNLARFISGINNKKGKKDKNLESIKFNLDGSIHVVLYTIRNIHPGEILYYDYNAGPLNEKDTSDFVVEPKKSKKK